MYRIITGVFKAVLFQTLTATMNKGNDAKQTDTFEKLLRSTHCLYEILKNILVKLKYFPAYLYTSKLSEIYEALQILLSQT